MAPAVTRGERTTRALEIGGGAVFGAALGIAFATTLGGQTWTWPAAALAALGTGAVAAASVLLVSLGIGR